MNRFAYLWLLPSITLAFSSCAAVGGIYKAGFWTAIILIVLVIVLILWITGMGRKRS